MDIKLIYEAEEISPKQQIINLIHNAIKRQPGK